MTGNVREALRRSGVFQGLDDADLGRIEEVCERREFAEGALIVEEDGRGGQVFLILSGRVDIEIRPPFDGKHAQRIATLRSGELFGEVSLVDGFLRSANARAADKCSVVSIDDGKLRGLMDGDPAFGYRVMKNVARILATRIRDTNMKLRNTLAENQYY